MKGIFLKLRMVYTMAMIRSKANPTHTKINISTTEPETLEIKIAEFREKDKGNMFGWGTGIPRVCEVI